MSDEVEKAAKFFHDRYEELAPHYGWKTQEQSRVEWEDLPENQKDLMTHVVGLVMSNKVIFEAMRRHFMLRVEIGIAEATGIGTYTYPIAEDGTENHGLKQLWVDRDESEEL